MERRDFRLAGRIKSQPEDFVVEEVWRDFLCTTDRPWGTAPADDPKDYLLFTLVKRNWDTVKALGYIADRLHISLKRFGIAGMKDKRALTAQRISAWRVKAEELMSLILPDIFLKDFSYSGDRINLGDAEGNRFTITIRDIPLSREAIATALGSFEAYLRENRVPNYFGPQRIGRAGENVMVGRAMMEGRLDEAINILLEKVRPYMEQERIKEIPDIFWMEKRMLMHLREKPGDYAGALRKIPKKILRIFPHALQSQIFNERLEQAISAGDVPESIAIEGFEIGKMPELKAYRIHRRSYIDFRDFKILGIDDGITNIRFVLGKGAYATVFLSHLVDLP